MSPNRFFVYGTLCRGNCRAGMWPHPPEAIESAWITGGLYDGPGYPAMRRDPAPQLDPSINKHRGKVHDEKVRGELWIFRDEHVADVTRVLDRIEGTNQPASPNLYDRIVFEAFDWNNQSLGSAWAYQYACDPILHGFKRIAVTENAGLVQWLA